MSLSRRLRVLILGLAVQVCAASHALAQCAMCKEAVDADKAAGGNVADGISYAILLMLSLPLLIGSAFGFAIWRAYKKAGACAIS